MLLYSQQQRNEHIVQEIVFLMALSYNKKVKEPAFDSLGEANNMEIAAILQPGSGWSMETASSSVLKAQKERERVAFIKVRGSFTQWETYILTYFC